MSGYDLFLGCVIPARFPYLETSARKVFEHLGITLNDVDGFSCCPDPTGVKQVANDDAWLVLGARNLSLCNKNGGVMSLCSGCVETLKGVNHSLKKDPSKLEFVNSRLSRINKSYDVSVAVTHFAEVLYENIDRIKELVVRPLEGLKVAVHYGCHYLRPSEVIQGDDPFEPVTVDAIIRAIGAESVEYNLKMECCGNPVSKTDKDLSLEMISNKYRSITDSGAQCVAVVCPACYQQFEFNQRDASKLHETEYKLPIFYLSELVALAFGFEPSELGMNFHRVKPLSLLESLQIVEKKE
ncbi:MAG: CoB--CoM heterodisulfide reductase iron-sulfur subunit B family protein [Promethearchaeota archaeon]